MRIFRKKELPVKLDFSACGKIMIDGMRFSFSVSSDGKSSEKGLCVSFSGEAIDSGEVKLKDLEIMQQHKGKLVPRKLSMPLVTKKDGKKIYQAKLHDLKIADATQRVAKGQTIEDALSSIISKDISFKVTPVYSGDDEPEIMLNVYPYENALTGSCTKWLKCTSDKDWFEHNMK
ncbi:hypothetical protein [Ruminococcus sp. FC2018]|uniref:hypothetical protein n=1 Tax=Ruminococcus sp. FC2018 TaxID=1410617 RepID=UPI00068784F0|nr:hypothetical protein [Ruminococcus sp. FC2018]